MKAYERRGEGGMEVGETCLVQPQGPMGEQAWMNSCRCEERGWKRESVTERIFSRLRHFARRF